MTPFLRCGMLVALALTQTAQADFYLHHWENRQEADRKWRVWSEFNYFRSTKNYNRQSQSEEPIGLELMTKSVVDIGASYGIGKRFSLFGRGSWAAVGVDAIGNSATSYGFVDQTFGMNTRLIEPGKKGFSLDFQFQTDFAVYDNQAATLKQQPFLGDGSVDFTGGGFLAFPFHSVDGQPGMWLHAGAGFTHRTDGFSQAIPWSVVAKYLPMEPGLYGSIGLYGTHSLKNDSRTPLLALNSFAEQSYSQLNGGSYIANAVNPSLMTMKVTLGFQNTPTLGFSVNAGKTLAGTNAPNGFILGLGVQIYPEGAVETRAPVGSPDERFKTYSLEARVSRVDDKRGLIRIDKGVDAGVVKGEEWDVFQIRSDGSVGDPVARAEVTAVGAVESSIKVTEYYKEVFIEAGFVAKRVIE